MNIEETIDKYLNESFVKKVYDEMVKGRPSVEVGKLDMDDFTDELGDKVFYLEDDENHVFINKGQHWYKIGANKATLVTNKSKIRQLDNKAEYLSN